MQRQIKYKTGFTIAELLVALVISSILLVAVAFAFQSSITNYRENEDIFKVINNARQALFRITTQLRTADAVMIGEPSNQCTFQTPDLESITYEYRSADNKLYLITNSDGNEYVLCDNVTAMTFTRETFYDSDDDLTKVKSVQISMTVVNGDIEKTISAAAVIRRNLN
jgi:prepilin-type N-terminal cleavage/methylation domain-containing protein